MEIMADGWSVEFSGGAVHEFIVEGHVMYSRADGIAVPGWLTALQTVAWLDHVGRRGPAPPPGWFIPLPEWSRHTHEEHLEWARSRGMDGVI